MYGFMYVCMCVCMYVCMYVGVYVVLFRAECPCHLDVTMPGDIYETMLQDLMKKGVGKEASKNARVRQKHMRAQVHQEGLTPKNSFLRVAEATAPCSQIFGPKPTPLLRFVGKSRATGCP